MIIHQMQQGSPEWHELRLGKVTGSRLKEVMGKDNLTLVDRLIAEEFCGQTKDEYTSTEMQRGLDLEPLARKAYEDFTGYTVKCCGFIQSKLNPQIGISPDGLIGDDGALEIKAPNPETHIRYIRQKKLPNEYKFQVLMYFICIPKLDWLDFMSYDPRFAVKPMYIHRSTRDDLKLSISEAEHALEKFFIKLERERTDILF